VVILIHEWWGLDDNIKTMAEDIHARDSMRLPLTCLTGRFPPIVMKLKPKPKPVKLMQRSPHGLIKSRPLAMAKLPRLADVLEVVVTCQPL
jgi:hypothetical protein